LKRYVRVLTIERITQYNGKILETNRTIYFAISAIDPQDHPM